jgi:hypothetical protein
MDWFLDFCINWRWVVSFTLLPFYPQGKTCDTHWIGGWLGLGACLDDVKKWTFLILPASSQSVHQLLYWGSFNSSCKHDNFRGQARRKNRYIRYINIQSVSEIVLQWYSKCYCVASVTKTFALKGVQTIHRSTPWHSRHTVTFGIPLWRFFLKHPI